MVAPKLQQSTTHRRLKLEGKGRTGNNQSRKENTDSSSIYTQSDINGWREALDQAKSIHHVSRRPQGQNAAAHVVAKGSTHSTGVEGDGKETHPTNAADGHSNSTHHAVSTPALAMNYSEGTKAFAQSCAANGLDYSQYLLECRRFARQKVMLWHFDEIVGAGKENHEVISTSECAADRAIRRRVYSAVQANESSDRHTPAAASASADTTTAAGACSLTTSLCADSDEFVCEESRNMTNEAPTVHTGVARPRAVRSQALSQAPTSTHAHFRVPVQSRHLRPLQGSSSDTSSVSLFAATPRTTQASSQTKRHAAQSCNDSRSSSRVHQWHQCRSVPRISGRVPRSTCIPRGRIQPRPKTTDLDRTDPSHESVFSPVAATAAGMELDIDEFSSSVADDGVDVDLIAAMQGTDVALDNMTNVHGPSQRLASVPEGVAVQAESISIAITRNDSPSPVMSTAIENETCIGNAADEKATLNGPVTQASPSLLNPTCNDTQDMTDSKDALVALLNALREELSCPVCVEHSHDMLVLHCGHSVCVRCALQLFGPPPPPSDRMQGWMRLLQSTAVTRRTVEMQILSRRSASAAATTVATNYIGAPSRYGSRHDAPRNTTQNTTSRMQPSAHLGYASSARAGWLSSIPADRASTEAEIDDVIARMRPDRASGDGVGDHSCGERGIVCPLCRMYTPPLATVVGATASLAAQRNVDNSNNSDNDESRLAGFSRNFIAKNVARRIDCALEAIV